MTFCFPDYVGLVGVLVTLVAYFLLQIEKLPTRGYLYSSVNALGSILIMVSLYYHFNLASFLMEATWLIISVYGIVKIYLIHHKRAKRAP